MYSMNSMPSDKKWIQLYSKHDKTLENILVTMKYQSELSNSKIKKEINKMIKDQLDDFFKRAN